MKFTQNTHPTRLFGPTRLIGTWEYQVLTNDDEVCIPSLSSILLAVMTGHEVPTDYLVWATKANKIWGNDTILATID